MKEQPLRTTVIGSLPFPGWLELASAHLESFGPEDLEEMIEDGVATAVRDQWSAGLDVVTDGEQSRLDFNLSFYGALEGIEREGAPRRRFGPPAHDQRPHHKILGSLSAPRGLGVVEEFQRLGRIAAQFPIPLSVGLKASLPGPYTLAGRLEPGGPYPDRWAVAEALLPIVQKELSSLASAGCREICLDEPSMSCYAHREDPKRLVDFFNRTVEPVRGRARLCTHLCFGNYKGRAAGPRRYRPMFPAFLDLHVDEMHLEMASREFSELEYIGPISKRMDVAVGIVDVKSSHIETPAEILQRVSRCLEYVGPDRLVLAPDCGLSQTARWAARRKLVNLVEGVRMARKEIGV